MPDDEQFIQQFIRSQAPDGSETLREVIHPATNGPLDAAAAQQLEASQGRAFLGFVDPSAVPQMGAQPVTAPVPTTGPQSGAPSPDVAIAASSSSGTTPASSLGQRAAFIVAPPRTFWSQLPSIGGAVLGGVGGTLAGAATGPFAPVAIPVLATAGAAAGSGAGEYAQIKGEQALGAAPAEGGGTAQRVEYAATRGALAEAGGQALRGAGYLASRAVLPTAQAAEAVAPVLEQTPVGNLVRDASGKLTSINQLLKNPAAVADFDVAPGDQLKLLQSWWNRTVPDGQKAVVAAWDALGPGGQATVAGDHLGAMQTLVGTLRSATAPLSARDLTVGGLPGVLLKTLGLGGPQAMGVGLGVAAARRAPSVAMAPFITSPTASQWLAALPQAAGAAPPWLSAALRGAATQSGLAEVWPSAPVTAPTPGAGTVTAEATP